MSWQEIAPASGTRSIRPGTVGVKLFKLRSAWLCTVVFAPDVVETLKWRPGETRLVVAFGEGEHAGLMRIEPVSKTQRAAFRLSKRRISRFGSPCRPYVRFGALDHWEWKPQPEFYCEWQAEGAALIVTLPDWARPIAAEPLPAKKRVA